MNSFPPNKNARKRFRIGDEHHELSYAQLIAREEEIRKNTSWPLERRNREADRIRHFRIKAFPFEWKADCEARLAQIETYRWDSFLDPPAQYASADAYRLSHDDVVRRVRRKRENPRKGEAQNRVTDFSGWIYNSIYGQSDAEALVNGKRQESHVASLKRTIPLLSRGEWELIYRDPLDEKPEPLEISLLRVKDLPLYGAPDYVFRHAKSQKILIVEIKVSDQKLPSDGWPNLRAQLWAYGHIDQFVNDASEIVLIGETWRSNAVQPSQVLQWDMSMKKFYAENKELFEIYQSWV